MTRRANVVWPDATPFAGRDGEPIRILAVSDDPDLTLDDAHNREALGRVDLVVGCGDLERHHLGFLGDAFAAPVWYVRGNHDRGANWEHAKPLTPEPMEDGRFGAVAGLRIVGLSWPGRTTGRAGREDVDAWIQALRTSLRLSMSRRRGPVLMLSHVPPLGAGDDLTDPYHTGFAAYRWLLRRVRPPLWLHGHTTVATVSSMRVEFEGTTLINVTGAVLVTLEPPSGAGRDRARATTSAG